MKLRHLSLGITALFLLASCSIEGIKARMVANAFLTAVVNEDFEKAAGYATKTGKIALQTLQSLNDGVQELRNKMGEDTEEGPKTSFKITGISVDGDKALATYTMTDSDGPQTLELEKIEGEWKVNFKKTR